MRRCSYRGPNRRRLRGRRRLFPWVDFAWKQGALAEARACHEESLTLSRNAGDLAHLSWALSGLGTVSSVEHDLDAARASFEEALPLARELGESDSIGLA